MSKTDRPAPLRLESLSCTVVRPRPAAGPQDGRWYWRARRGDETLWTGWATREEADVVCARLTLGEAGGAAVTIRDLMETWFAGAEDLAAAGQLAETSLDTMRASVRAILRELGAVHIAAVTVATLERYRDVRLTPRAEQLRRAEGQRGRLPRRSGMATETVARELRMLRTAWAWGHERGLVPTATLPRVVVRPKPFYERYTPSAEEIGAVLERLEGWPWLAVRLYWATGCRLGEIATLRRRDVDASEAVLYVRGKTGPREVVIVPAVMAELLPHLPQDPDARLLGVTYGTARTSLRRYLADACAAAGVPRWTAQALRRFATDAIYETGADPGIEAAHLGHGPQTAMAHYRRARVTVRRRAVQSAGLGVLPATEGEGVVLLGVAARAAQEEAILAAAMRGDLMEVARLVAETTGTATAQTRRKGRM